MSTESPQSEDSTVDSTSTSLGPRRPRYAGTHPRSFDERYKELEPERFPGMHEHIRSQGRTPAGTHVPVMMSDVMEALRPGPGETVADCTVGFGGHAIEFLSRIGPGGKLIGLDLDGEQLARTEERINKLHDRRTSAGGGLPDVSAMHLFHMHFAGLAKVMREQKIDGYDIVFADLGVSSMQIDDPSRGFSYKFDGPLDMRMDRRAAKKAADILATIDESDLARALDELSDEPDHHRIASAIERHRVKVPITDTRQLVRIVFEAKGISLSAWRNRRSQSRQQIHPAALTFQALRMLVNDELSGLAQLLRLAPHCLRPGGRIGIISFHSGEDRLIKKSFREGLKGGLYERIAPNPVRASSTEVNANPRSASAKLRWAIRAKPDGNDSFTP